MNTAADAELTKLAIDFTVHDYKATRDAGDRKRIADGIRRRFTEGYILPVFEGPKRHGFTMMAVSCLMIEAFVSLQRGWKDGNGRNESAICSFIDDSDLFREFRPRGHAFYKHVRCGVLHQAEAIGGWKISRKGPAF